MPLSVNVVEVALIGRSWRPAMSQAGPVLVAAAFGFAALLVLQVGELLLVLQVGELLPYLVTGQDAPDSGPVGVGVALAFPPFRVLGRRSGVGMVTVTAMAIRPRLHAVPCLPAVRLGGISHCPSLIRASTEGGALAGTGLVPGRFVIRATHERGVGVPSSRSLSTASREANKGYTCGPTESEWRSADGAMMTR